MVHGKTCKRCGEWHPLSELKPSARASLGHQALCLDCSRLYVREWVERKRKEHAIVSNDGERQCPRCEITKPFTAFHINRSSRTGRATYCKDCTRERHNRDTWRAWYLRRQFGIEQEEYDRLLAEQGGVCAICSQPETVRGGNGKSDSREPLLRVDHDHATKKVRALLCHRCNVMLGNARDDPEILRAGAAYLARFS